MASGSFSFCGIDVKSLGLEYAPTIEETYVYKPAEAESHIETFEGHDGGYFYGAWKKPKEFSLRCVFEEIQIDRGIMAQIYALFKVGRSGKLIFDRRPWCYYYATVSEPVEEDFSNYLNGTITIHLKAMYPFARSDILFNTRTDQFHDAIMANSAVFDKPEMILEEEYSLTEQKTILLANQGTEQAALGFEISGDVGEGVTIANNTTGQKCKMVAISKAKTTDVDKKVFVDPISGKTLLIGNGEKKLAYIYHQYGFLHLESSFPAIRDIYINYSTSNVIYVTNILHQNLENKYIFIRDNWFKIVKQQDKHTLIISGNPSEKGEERTMVIPMNEIVITPDSEMDIKIKFIYKPTYS